MRVPFFVAPRPTTTDQSVDASQGRRVAWTPLSGKNSQSLIVAMAMVFLPHLFYLPMALRFLVIAMSLMWQFRLRRTGQLNAHRYRFGQYVVVLVGLVAIYAQFKSFVGIEAGCASLVVILLGKMFEVKHYRDAIVQFNFGLFVAATTFLYGQSIGLALSVLSAIFACLYGMYQLQSHHRGFEEVTIHEIDTRVLRYHALKQVAKLIGLAAPLMIILFLLVPRFPPLWNMPLPDNRAKTGMSDRVAPGDIARLSQSSDLAFRAIFGPNNQHIPDQSSLYWRAMTLEQFDGVAWSQHPYHKYTGLQLQANTPYVALPIPTWLHSAPSIQRINYQLLIEPNNQHWLFALDYSIAAAPLILKPDMSIQTALPIEQRRQFNLQLLTPKPIADAQLSPRLERIDLQLPPNANPKSRQFAQQLFVQSGRNPKRYIQTILNWIATAQFRYTLSPPLLGQNRVDDFLFRTRAGFCEHYASAFVNLMRMADIPARMVVGYQGGKAAPDGQTWEVRQLDAHAWTEVWLNGQGWVRIDPTAAIAPERVQLGMQDYSSQSSTLFGDATLTRLQSRWLTQARIWADYVNYQWQSKVVGFDQSKQQGWLKRWSLDHLGKQILALLVILGIATAFIVWRLTRVQAIKRSKLERALERWSKKLQPFQLERHPNEPILSWIKRIEEQRPHAELGQIRALITQHYYLHPLQATELKLLLDLIEQNTKVH